MNYIRENCLSGAALDEFMTKMNMIYINELELQHYIRLDNQGKK